MDSIDGLSIEKSQLLATVRFVEQNTGATLHRTKTLGSRILFLFFFITSMIQGTEDYVTREKIQIHKNPYSQKFPNFISSTSITLNSENDFNDFNLKNGFCLRNQNDKV